MECPNCKKETSRLTIVTDDDGRPFTFCGECPRPKAKELNFPAIRTGKRGRGRPSRLDACALSPEEIARTQAMRPSVISPDTPEKRKLDDVQGFIKGTRKAVYVGGNSPDRGRLAMAKAKQALGSDNIRIISDNGLKIVAEKVA